MPYKGNVPTEAVPLPSKKPSVCCGTPPLDLLVRSVPEISKTMQAILLALVHPSELDMKTLLLKTPHTLAAGHRKARSTLDQKLLPGHLAFQYWYVGCWEKVNMVLPSCEPDALQ